MQKLLFQMNDRLFTFTVTNYKLENDFYIFTDTIDGKTRKLHKNLFRGEVEA